jgi:hypothetical protein
MQQMLTKHGNEVGGVWLGGSLSEETAIVACMPTSEVSPADILTTGQWYVTQLFGMNLTSKLYLPVK